MLYHVTPSENVNNILKVGLIPHIGKASKQVKEDRPRIYLFTSLEWVKESIETWFGEVYWNKDLSFLSINTTPKEIGGEVHGGEVWVDDVISPSLIDELYPPEEIDKALGLEY